eukprot:229683-Pelagomonas_calceolata.AAC.1
MADGHAQLPRKLLKFEKILPEVHPPGREAWTWAKKHDFLTLWRAARAAFLFAGCPLRCLAA